MKKNKIKLHGECMIFKSKIPKTAKRKNVQNYLIVGESETSGNHHVALCEPGVDFFEDENGTLFMENSGPAKIQCLQAERHDEMVIEPGVWEFGTQQEYDYFAESHRAVKD